MLQDTLASRVTRYLQRHLAHLEEALRALESADFSREETLLFFERLAEKGDQLDAEQAALLKEWGRGDTVSAVERAAVKALAAQADALAGQLRVAYDAAAADTRAASVALREQAETLHRGGETARRFAPRGSETGGFLDHSA